jgi:AcrR family transcriptional regulator
MTERRTRLSPEERRAQLVALGVNALADRPLEALTIEDLAAQAGVSRGLVFYYFESKQGFHREVVRAARDGLLRATEPSLDLEPIERLRSTLGNLVQFVREHEPTFYSLVRGAASSDPAVREVVDQARALQTERVFVVCREMGVPDSALLRVALRSWVALAEEMLLDAAIATDMAADDLVSFLERSLLAVVGCIDPGQGPTGLGAELSGGRPAAPPRAGRGSR